ncbi:MAG TPA: autotransporter-associated beta strand repeat-containing protein, partial [Candidatus Anammoximicrobium sp.]|nr:autotransporter-associated beta strand repeat-containing protein [Candidatus Anammoximicrobium sp.]
AAGASLSNPAVVTTAGTGTATLGSYSSGPAAVFSGPLTLNRPVTLTDATGDRTTFSGTISGAVGTITITGYRVTFANGANDFVGDLTINGGSIYQNDTAGAIPDATSVLADGTFQLNGASETINALNGIGVVTNFAGSNTLTVGGADGSGTFTGGISDGSGPLALLKTGTGTQTLTPITGPVTYDATFLPATATTVVVVPNGKLVHVTGVPAAIMSGAYISPQNAPATAYNFSNNGTTATFANVVFQGGYTKAVKIQLTNSGGGVQATVLAAKYWNGDVRTGFNFDTTPGGNTTSIATSDSAAGYGCKSLTLALSSPYTGGLTVSQGTVLIGNGSGAGTGTVTLNDANTGANNTTFLATGPFTVPNAIVVANEGTGTSTIGTTDFSPGGVPTYFTGPLTLNRATTFQGGNTDRTTYQGRISGSGPITIASVPAGGRRTTWENNSNDFTGNIAIAGTGTILQIGTHGAASTVIPDAVDVDVGAEAFFYFDTGAETIDGLSGSGTVQKHPAVGGTMNFTLGADNASSTFTGRIINGSGTLNLTQAGNGTLTLTNATSSYNGVTTYRGGIVSVPVLTGGNAPSPIGGAVGYAQYQVFDGGTLQYTGPTVAINRPFRVAAGGGTIEVTDPGTILTLNDAAGATDIDGTAAGGGLTLTGAGQGMIDNEILASVNGGLTKSGTGTWTLTRANTYTGSTLVDGGTLLVTGAIVAASNVAVNNAGSVLGGTGTAAGSVTVNAGAAIAPGTTGTGIFNVGSSGQVLTFADSSQLSIQLGGTPPTDGSGAGSNDQVNAVGAVTVGDNVALAVTAFGGYTPAGGEAFVVLRNDADDAIGGTFAALAEGATYSTDFLGSGLTARITYYGGDGNDVALIVDGDAVFTGDGTGENFELRRLTSVSPAYDLIQLLRGGVVVDSRPFASVTSYTVDAQGGNDSLAVNYGASGGFFPQPVTFQGGTGANALAITGGTFGTETYNYTGAANGQVQLAGPAASITYTEVSGITATNSTTDRVFNLPATDDAVILGDDGTGGNSLSRLWSAGGTFAATTFANPAAGGSATVNARGGNDTLAVAGLPDFNRSLTLAGDADSDTTILAGTLTLAGGDLTVTAEAIQLHSDSITTGGGDVLFDGPVTLAGGLPQVVTGDANAAVYYRLNETSGTTALDSMSPANNGTLYNGVLINQPAMSSALVAAMDFDGTNDYLEVPYDAALNPVNFTVEAWARVEGGSSHRAVVSSRDQNPEGLKGFILYATPSNTWEFWTGNFSGWNVLAGPAVTNNAWTHFAMTFQATSGPDANGLYTGVKSLYVNGALAASAAGSYKPNSLRNLRIGAGANEGGATYFFNGKLDEVSVYDRVFSAIDVARHYATSFDAATATTKTIATSGGNLTFSSMIATGGNHLTLNGGAAGDITVVGTLSGGGDLHVIDGDVQSYAAIAMDNVAIDAAGTSVTFGDTLSTTESASVTSGGTISLTGAAIGTAFDLTATGAISNTSDIAVGGTLTKGGAGTFTLVADNSAAATQVNGGTLLVNGTLASPVSATADAVLGGTGTINGTVELAAGST